MDQGLIVYYLRPLPELATTGPLFVEALPYYVNLPRNKDPPADAKVLSGRRL